MKKLIIILVISLFTTYGYSNDELDYNNNSVGQVSEVFEGTVINVAKVHLDGNMKGGAEGGALAGGYGGAMAGAGSGNIIGGVVGAVGGAIAGGLLGAGTEDAITEGEAYQFIIKTNEGKEISVMQKDLGSIHIGSNVQILYSGNNTRIIPIT